MKRFLYALFLVSALSFLSVPSSANVFNLGPGLTNLQTVTVGDPGNAPDLRYGTPGYGSVAYSYRIGKYEVTAAQYCDFLNHKAASDPRGLYDPWMWTSSYGCKILRDGSPGSYTYGVTADYANRPVNFVSYWDSLRFINWLQNGQGNGDTETGAYALNGYNGTDGRNILRNPQAVWFLPNDDEWYKAAYYKGGGSNAGYWDYPTQNDTTPSNQLISPDPGNNANWRVSGYTIDRPYFRTEVGVFVNSESTYGTYDQGGNVREWNETIGSTSYDSAYRRVRGGSYATNVYLKAGSTHIHAPDRGQTDYGFRVVQAVPEPSALVVLAGGAGMILGLRRRRA